MNKLTHKRVVDKLIDAYVSWREACLRVSDAYGSWAGETGPAPRGRGNAAPTVWRRRGFWARTTRCVIRSPPVGATVDLP
jgi:hypothetical protein